MSSRHTSTRASRVSRRQLRAFLRECTPGIGHNGGPPLCDQPPHETVGMQDWGVRRLPTRFASLLTAPTAPHVGPRVSFRTSTGDATDLTTYSFTSQDIGDPSPDRHIVVGIGAINNVGGTTLTVSSGSVGGIATTTLETQNDGNATTSMAALIIAAVPTGTTATIAFTLSAASARTGIGVWAVYGLQLATARDTGKSSADPAVVDVDVLVGDVVIAMSYSNDTTTTSTWAGVTENFDGVVETVGYSGGSTIAEVAATPRTVRCDFAGTAIRRSAVSVVLR